MRSPSDPSEPAGQKRSVHAGEEDHVLLFGEILRRPACGAPPQDDKGHRGDFLGNDRAMMPSPERGEDTHEQIHDRGAVR